MKAMLSRRPSAAMVVALIALFAATGGVGYAAATIDSGDIVNNTVRSKDVHNRDLRATDVKKESLGGGVIKESTLGQVPSAASADTAQQATNAQDAVNAQNAVNSQTAAAVGPNGVGPAALQSNSVRAAKLGSIVVRTGTVSVPSSSSAGLELGCQAGEELLSGGARWSANGSDYPFLRMVHSYPVNTTWFARGHNATAAARDLTVRVLCLDN
jgi:hypothetical protein